MKMNRFFIYIILLGSLSDIFGAQDSLNDQATAKVQLSSIEINDQFVDFNQLSDPNYQDKFAYGKILSNSFDSIVPHYNYPVSLQLPYVLNDLTFHFIAIDWKAPHKIKYSYQLEGKDEEWSALSLAPFASFEDLSHGSYILKIKAAGEDLNMSDIFRYDFSIDPPFYLSSKAYVIYFILLIAVGLGFYQINENQKRKRMRIQEILKEYKILSLGNTHLQNLSAGEDRFVRLINQTLETHLSDENFGIAELCDILNISRAQLHRKLKKLTGLSTSHYIRSLRLHFAKELLENSELNISEIAFNVGFSSATYFSRAFKAEFGHSPSEMR
jgi:AraC-like DNA-binding protein